MGFLNVLEDKHLTHVPATVILNEQDHQHTEETAGLKRGSGKDADIILIPQPSEDPNDPLNWSTTKKWTIMSIVAFGSVLYAAVLAPLLSPALVLIAMDFGKQIGDITVISGYMLLVTGGVGPLVSALSRKYGKRPMLLLASIFGLIGTVVCSAAYSYEGLLAGRIIQGGSISAFESLVVAMIGDLFFVHQRGGFMTLIQFILGAASNFSAIIVGPIATNLGWRYLFHILIPFVAIECILLYFFVPETTYIRDHRYDIDELSNDNLADLAAVEKRHATPGNSQEKEGNDMVKIQTTTSSPPGRRPKKTFVQELAIFTGTYSSDNLLQLTIAPFAVCANLAVLWMVIVTGGLTALFVAQSYDMAQIFMAPPYGLTAAGVGYLSLGPFLGGLFGSIMLGATLDPLIKWCAKKNGGVYEPEYRLLGMIPSIFIVIGLCLFGYLAEKGSSFYATAFFHGMDLFGIVCAAIAASTYVLDSFRDISSEVFIMNMVFKNFLFYGFSYFVNDWTKRDGPAKVFYVFGGLAAAMIVTTPVFFFWGKKYRSYWHRHNLLQMWGITTHAEL
ncbi:MFS general substrate transporter [Cucurbitaria berberidis CBS 394.84]|uniref:MFS general substrate transporter n=1 Tax=Cucurbitaria berberidis CBS 394.84 TaxID=1168544 RepID=A0A9P4GTV8_9PLEO|nr:MFS general substrate transporter [Cucurbitaria berberidis CBS 394.84]KAF1851655.1 MFS general substrate transporter [Cucurbitaria berberidis CBS 394.84]